MSISWGIPVKHCYQLYCTKCTIRKEIEIEKGGQSESSEANIARRYSRSNCQTDCQLIILLSNQLISNPMTTTITTGEGRSGET